MRYHTINNNILFICDSYIDGKIKSHCVSWIFQLNTILVILLRNEHFKRPRPDMYFYLLIICIYR